MFIFSLGGWSWGTWHPEFLPKHFTFFWPCFFFLKHLHFIHLLPSPRTTTQKILIRSACGCETPKLSESTWGKCDCRDERMKLVVICEMCLWLSFLFLCLWVCFTQISVYVEAGFLSDTTEEPFLVPQRIFQSKDLLT